MSGPLSHRAIKGIAVVVPVHDEEARLGACLDSLHRALDHPAVRALPSLVVVVLDDCTDHSGVIAANHARSADHVVTITARNVGVARAAGSVVALRDLHRLGIDSSHAWLSHTDADSIAPPWWMARQLRYAVGADAIAGIVRVDDWSEHEPGTARRFGDDYHRDVVTPTGLRAHPHVHGANLGVRGDAYLEAGGFPALACSEDHALWQALQHDGRTLLSTRRIWVTTSGRRVGRAVGGFADTIAALNPAIADPDADRRDADSRTA